MPAKLQNIGVAAKRKPVVSQQRVRIKVFTGARTAKTCALGPFSPPPGRSSLSRTTCPLVLRSCAHLRPGCTSRPSHTARCISARISLHRCESCAGTVPATAPTAIPPLPTASCQISHPCLQPFTRGREWAQTPAEWLRLRRRSVFKNTCYLRVW